ncbi:MAG TPA: Ku protein [Methylomirabilota bacterium]|jgi:DNA end-binding protein Ku|nr:Ku protein [Methylomirabilota bacterium]
MKSIWNGAISFGLVNIPVKVYPAVKKSETNFHYLHGEDLGRITTERLCRKCHQFLDYNELVRGYELEKGRYVPLTEEELENVHLESMKIITITDFVDPQEIAPGFFEKPYYLAPDEDGEELYVLLREALRRTQKAGVAKFSWYDRERLAVIRPEGEALLLHLLYFAEELSRPEDLKFPEDAAQLGTDELALAEQLINVMARPFEPQRYHNTYWRQVRELVEKKQAGIELEANPVPRPPTQIREVVSKLKASIEQAEQQQKDTLAA